ncbi:ovostatin homolog 2-like [Episyrphus balteatus]|uniref:ovostatin homolog 2-like n=1 Tax=Episyrphus balteatus TaxID=286459 RepID=UPI0024868E59|nr:ovostatin homolog 2-like [Episyrphus balteatus]
MSQDALTNLTIESNIEDLDILEHSDDISTTKQIVSKLIPSQKRDKFTYFLKPLKRGQYNITVKAMSSKASDTVQKTLLVEPQGIPQEMSKSYLVHLPEEGSLEDEITIDIPENAVPGSQRIELSVVGDIFRPLMMILQKLARVPYGNGEDNMKLIVSNSIVLKYLNVLNYSDPSLEIKIRQNLELGYQNQLSFKYLDGSFGLFERKTERTGDIWQTIFSLWGLQLAQDFVYVQDKVMNRGLDYLQSKQQKNGCYKSENSLEDDVKLTAFGLMVFLMDEDSRTKYNETVSKGLEYLNDIWSNLEYTPISVMAAYVLFLGEHEKAEDYLKILTSKAHLTNDQEQWTKSETLQSHLETTTESLMKVFESQEIPEQNLLHIARGLILSKNEESSIIHMVALNTLITFVKKLLLSDTNLNISFKDDQNKSGDFLLTKENSEVLQKFELTSSSRNIKLKSKGHGFALVDVNYVYNLLPQNQTSSIYSTNISLEYYSKVFNYLTICSSVLTNDTHSKFVIIDINVQSGYAFTETSFNEIENLNEDIKSIKFSNARDKAVIYYEYDPSNELCVELELRRSYNVLNSKPGWIMVYGEQSKEQGASNSFKFYDS